MAHIVRGTNEVLEALPRLEEGPEAEVSQLAVAVLVKEDVFRFETI